MYSIPTVEKYNIEPYKIFSCQITQLYYRLIEIYVFTDTMFPTVFKFSTHQQAGYSNTTLGKPQQCVILMELTVCAESRDFQ